jgi:hypothetical protein
MNSANNNNNTADQALKLRVLSGIWTGTLLLFMLISLLILNRPAQQVLLFSSSQLILLLNSLVLYLIVFTHCYNRLPLSFTISFWIPGIIASLAWLLPGLEYSYNSIITALIIFPTLAIPLIFAFNYLVIQLRVQQLLLSYPGSGSLKALIRLSALYLVIVAVNIYEYFLIINLSVN